MDNLHLKSDQEKKQIIHLLLEQWSDSLSCQGDYIKQIHYKKKFVDRLKNSPIAIETQAANQQHYEVPTEFFLKVLGKHLKYSCCLWNENCEALEQAEQDWFQVAFERLRLPENQPFSLLDLGCGWGSLSFEVCRRYPKSSVLAVSNSATQRKFIEAEAKRRGYNNLRVQTADANFFTPTEKFDRIVSIEMFEHMKNYEILLQRIRSWLNENGLLFVQILCHARFTYPFVAKEGSEAEWMAKYFFSGGTMPSVDLLLHFQKDMLVEEYWVLNGEHYSKTLLAWLKRMDQQESEVREIFRKNYVSYSEKELDDLYQKWRTFFLYCAHVFNFRNGNEWLVAQYLFSPRSNPTSSPTSRVTTVAHPSKL